MSATLEGRVMTRNKLIMVMLAVGIVGFLMGAAVAYEWRARQDERVTKYAILQVVLSQSVQVQLLAAITNNLGQKNTVQTKKYLCASMATSVDAMHIANKDFTTLVDVNSFSEEGREQFELSIMRLKAAEQALISAKCG